MKIRTKRVLTALTAALMLSPTSAFAQTHEEPAADGADTAPILTCTTADEWTALFERSGKEGWLGADGIYSVSLDGNDAIGSANPSTKTFFIFSDTLMGIADDKGKVTTMYTMPNHSSAILEGNAPDPDKISFVYGYKGSMSVNSRVNLFAQEQWMFDCFTVGDAIYLLAFTQSQWKPVQIDMIKLPIVDGEVDYQHFERTKNIENLLKITDNVHYDFGMGVLNNTESAGAPDPDGYLYFYGYKDNINEFSRKDLIISRLSESDFPDFSKLTYWNGEEWGSEIEESAVILSNVSCEVSVTPITGGPYKGKYIAIYTQGVQTAHMMYAIGDSPVGPFAEPVEFYTAPESGQPSKGAAGTLYTYNAKAHPHLSQDGKLLISYNVNDTYGIATDVYDYHPRFLYLDLQYTEEEIAALNPGATTNPAVVTTEPPSTENPVVTDSAGNTGVQGGIPTSTAMIMAAAVVGVFAVGALIGAVIGKKRR
ncbi:MAG: DUF4185 domain-containing protein [Eubacteriales bacterium]